MPRKTDKFLDKLVKKDFNNELEEVLEKKSFEENTKSILLSILYKIEIAYKDYEKVKQDVETQDEFINTLIKQIKNNCDSIKIVRPNSEESKMLCNKPFLVEKETKRIICYPIERKLLYAISKISKKDIIINSNYFLINKTISDLINIGNSINEVEAMRDFNGYSWTTLPREVESISHNIIYQNLRILVGNKFLNKWIKNNQYIIDYYELLKTNLDEKYGERTQRQFIKQLEELSILLAIKYNRKIKNEMEKEKIETIKKLRKMNDNQKFVEDIAKEKKKLTKEIKLLDETINDRFALQKEYDKRNEILPLEEKIFSAKILSKMLRKEREEKLENLNRLNELLKPGKFVSYKKQLELNLKKLQMVEIQNLDEEIEKNLKKLQMIFLKCYEIKIEKAQTKQKIIKLIYEFRYYCLIPFNLNTNAIIEVKELEKQIEKLQRQLIYKAHQVKAIGWFSKNMEIDYQILKYLFSIRVINLEDLNVKFVKEKEKIFMQLFDDNISNEKIEIGNIRKNELEVKLNKKIKVFD